MTTHRRKFLRMRMHLYAIASLLAVVACAQVREVPVVEVTGSDFAFIAPDTLDPGPTRFRFVRTGTVEHEMAIARVKQGITLAQALTTEMSGGDVETVYDVGDGLLFAAVGETVEAELLIDLQPGRHYVLNCTRVTNGKPHTMLGMAKGVTVRVR